jgi:hypothetical protein
MTKPEEAPRLTEWATAGTIAETLGISRQSVNRMVRDGDFETLVVLPGVRDQYLIKTTELHKVEQSRNEVPIS